MVDLVLVIALFAASAAKTLSTTPQVAVPTFGLIVVAFIVGILTYRFNINLIISTVIGIALLSGSIVLGCYMPINASFHVSLICLLGYAFIASVLPVNILLQPRDYITSFVLRFGLIFGYLDLFVTHVHIKAPFYINWQSAQGDLWPMMFVIIACGANSGFHSLVAGGTTAKQLVNEKDARKIGYGAMLAEGLLAVLAVSAGLYWKGGTSGLVYSELMRGGNWVATFGTGYGKM